MLDGPQPRVDLNGAGTCLKAVGEGPLVDKWRCVCQSTGAIGGVDASKQVWLLINRLGVKNWHRSTSKAASMIIIDVLNNRYRSYRFSV